MAVDQNGYIIVPGFNGLQAAFSSVVRDVVDELIKHHGQLIHSIYLYGSIASGKAVKGISDLDLTIVTHTILSDAESVAFTEQRHMLEQRHSAITKIDYDFGCLPEVMNEENAYSWGYWLKHHCLCLCGDDLRMHFSPFRPSQNIAEAVNGDFMHVLENYDRLISSTDQIRVSQQLQRSAARKVIRATNLLREDNEKGWPETLEDHVAQFVRQFPSLTEEMAYWLKESREPEDEPGMFVERLRTFSYWLNAEHQTRQSQQTCRSYGCGHKSQRLD